MKFPAFHAIVGMGNPAGLRFDFEELEGQPGAESIGDPQMDSSKALNIGARYSRMLRQLSTVIRTAALCVLSTAAFGQNQNPSEPTACESTPHYTGYFEGSVTSKEAGALKVSLNLSCVEKRYSGELTTPVGKFAIIGGSLDENNLQLRFAAGNDTGTIQAEVNGTKLTGHFAMGDDSGPVDLLRLGDAKTVGYGRPTLALIPALWQEDLHYFATELPKEHANAFYHLSRPEFDSMIAKADTELAHADGDEAYVLIDRIANAIGDGHTFVIWPDDLSHVPLQLRLFDGEYRVTAVLPGNESSLGARVVKVGDMPIEQVLERLRPLTPSTETKELGDIRMEDFLAIGMLLHGTGVIPDRNSVTYTLANESGHQSTLRLSGMPMQEFMSQKWVTAFKERPLYLQGRDSGLWCEFLAASHTMYCNFAAYENLQQNAARMLAMVKERHPRQLAVDLRFNLGGDYMQGEKYVIQPLRALLEINSRGHLFVLIGPYTFSAGMSNAAQFRSETQAILVGQPIGERPNSYQEARELPLPNSHLVVRVSTRFYEFAPGHKDNVIRPDKEIDRTWKDYRAGRDAALDWVQQQRVGATHRMGTR
ncbi:MAG TPA: hypothetical protein VGJ51_16400 [Candidatus Angelobacter sp.]